MNWQNRIGERFEIIYIDQSGKFSQREIKVIAANEKYVKAFCFKRKKVRIFYSANVLSVAKVRRVS